MNRKSIIVLVLSGVGFTLAVLLHQLRAPQDLRSIQWPVMGTIARVTVRGTVPNESAVLDAVRHTYEEVESKLSAWNPNSELCRLAAAGCTNWTESASPAMRPCYAAALQLARESDNAFNPYMGRILRNYGIGKGKYSDFDLGAIAKGFAVDLAATHIVALWGQSPNERGQTPNERGQSLLLDLGGNLRVIGEHPWRTGIRNPFAFADLRQPEYCTIIALTNGESVATSGNYERFIEKDGKRLSHILDGRTGQPTSGIAGVTVVTPSDYGAILADGLSTTLFVLGPEAGCTFLAAHYPRALALWIPDTPEKPRLIATKEMAKRLEKPSWPLETR